MSHRPKVSICIPSYNHARYLPAAIESALAQTYWDFEIVIVDDGSTDDSLQIAESYAARYPSLIRVLTHPGKRNLGIGKTANLAFRESRGEYWTGLPSDDLYCSDKLERQVALLEGNPHIAWVYSYGKCIDEAGQRVPEFIFPRFSGKDITRSPDPLESLIQRNVIPAMSVLARRECLERSGPEDESLIYSDWERWIRLLAHSKVAFINRPLVMYRIHSYNTSVGVDTGVNMQRSLEVMQAVKRKSPSIGGALVRPRTQALLDLQLAYHFFVIGNNEESKRSLMAAFETDPTLRKDAKYFTRWLKERMYDLHAAFPPGAHKRNFSSWILCHLSLILEGSFMRRVEAVDFARAAFESYKTDLRMTRHMALKCLRHDSHWLTEKFLLSIFIESLVGSEVIGLVRRLKKGLFSNNSLEDVDRAIDGK